MFIQPSSIPNHIDGEVNMFDLNIECQRLYDCACFVKLYGIHKRTLSLSYMPSLIATFLCRCLSTDDIWANGNQIGQRRYINTPNPVLFYAQPYLLLLNKFKF